MNSSSFALTGRQSRRRFEPVRLLLAVLTTLLLVATSSAQHLDPAVPRNSSRSLQTDKSSDDGGLAGTLKGRVLLQESNRPLANATVVLRSAAHKGSPVLLATDEEGAFQASNLRPGAYTLTAVAPGYVTAHDDLSGQAVYYHVGDFVTLRMVKGGVITGRVLNTNGEPLAAAQVRAVRVKDAGGQPARDAAPSRVWRTDDRGVYRLYGLEPGSYLVAVAGNSPNVAGRERANIFYPSAGLANALPVQVMSGQESSGIDIRFREERAYTISGSVAGISAPRERSAAGIVITLTHTTTGVPIISAPLTPRDGTADFALDAVPDGDYEISARDASQAASLPRRLTVRGADVRGVALTLLPFGSIAGRVVLEAAPVREGGQCLDNRRALLEETVILAHAQDSQTDKPGVATPASTMPDAEGKFVLGNLNAGDYFVEPRLPSRNWYIRSAALSGANAASPFTLAVKQGAQVEGFNVTLAEGAASLRGRVVPAVEGASLPANLRVYLVPLEAESADDSLRYAQAPVGTDGEFGFDNLAPGRYLAIALTNTATKSGAGAHRAAADAKQRAQLRREAQTTNTTIELQPCQNSADFVLRYTSRGSVTR
ncbi:MAG TPA: carboxypeptidase-like regulatory domain-containing protein [Pyrinomonadaceae bacterium]|nr:carboxypeptidase-like regulatory domain-containing protein [Pyrinomonadaceae bacterium]